MNATDRNHGHFHKILPYAPVRRVLRELIGKAPFCEDRKFTAANPKALTSLRLSLFEHSVIGAIH